MNMPKPGHLYMMSIQPTVCIGVYYIQGFLSFPFSFLTLKRLLWASLTHTFKRSGGGP